MYFSWLVVNIVFLFRNGANGAHVQGVKDMVINTQKANIHKINSMLESNMNKVLSAKIIRGQKDKTLREAIKAAEQFKSKLEEEYKNNQSHSNSLVGFEAKLNGLRSKINKIEPLDYKNIKLIYEEAMHIKKSLKQEFDSVWLIKYF